MTPGRQLSYHYPAVATLKRAKLFVWQQGVLEGRDEYSCLRESQGVGMSRECSTDKTSKVNKKRNLAHKMSGVFAGKKS